jgi:hypothetical protein
MTGTPAAPFKKFRPFSLPAAFLLFLSCESLPFNMAKSQGWFMPKSPAEYEVTPNDRKKEAGPISIRLIGVSVDRGGGRDSLEREIAGLAPLLFWKYGYRVLSGDEQADYEAEIQAREREYSSGWRIKRSLALELRVWIAGNEPERRSAGKQNPPSALPLAAGRVYFEGERIFSSSKTTGDMLALVIRKTAEQLNRRRQGN